MNWRAEVRYAWPGALIVTATSLAVSFLATNPWTVLTAVLPATIVGGVIAERRRRRSP